jgi:integrase
LSNGGDLVRVRLKGVNAVTKRARDGTIKRYYYHRATGKPLTGRPGSAEFVASFAAASKAKPLTGAKAQSLSALIEEFEAAVEFGKLGQQTRVEYKRMLKTVDKEFGTLPIAALNDVAVLTELLEWQDKVAKVSGEREADNRLSVLSSALTWAKRRSKISVNHLRGFQRLYSSDRSEIIWLPEHVRSFMDKSPVELQPALILALHSGQREGDLIDLRWTAYDGACVRLRQHKSKRKGIPGPLIEIPCTRALKRMLDSIPRTSPFILTTKTGKKFKKRYFCRLWHEVMMAAGITQIYLEGLEDPVDLHFHDLRGTAITLLSEAGCTTQQIATITGHSLKYVETILKRYLARTRGLAEEAIAKFEASPRATFAHDLEVKKAS